MILEFLIISKSVHVTISEGREFHNLIDDEKNEYL